MTLGELLRTHTPEAAKMLKCFHGRRWNETCEDCGDDWGVNDTHWLAAKMAESTAWTHGIPSSGPPMPTRSGTMPNPYTTISTETPPPEPPTKREVQGRDVARAIRRL